MSAAASPATLTIAGRLMLARYCDQSGRTSCGRAPHAEQRSRRLRDGTSTDPGSDGTSTKALRPHAQAR